MGLSFVYLTVTYLSVLLCIGDLATQYFADRDIFCAGRVPEADLERVGRATGGVVQTSLADLNTKILGRCDAFEEKQIGPDRYNLFTGTIPYQILVLLCTNLCDNVMYDQVVQRVRAQQSSYVVVLNNSLLKLNVHYMMLL
jgi:chaperonin GroEL (HSP60 family)